MSDHAPRETFDYSVLDEQTREIVLRKTDETHGLMMRTAESIIAIGENLLAVQRHLPDMKFSAWLRAEFDLSRQSAYNFMRVATRLGGSCKTVLQLPARVLYELASSSDAVIEQVETGHLTPTVEAIKAAREAERLARLEAGTRQAAIERLTLEIEGLRRRLAEMPAPQIEIREMEKLVVPPETVLHLDILQQKIAALTRQREALSEQVSRLQEQVRAGASEGLEGEHERRVRLNWYKVTSEFQRSLRSMLSQWPAPLDVLAFEAGDWNRLSQVRELACRLIEECTRLAQGADGRIIDGSSVSVAEAAVEREASS